jgi:hypothetical protein
VVTVSELVGAGHFRSQHDVQTDWCCLIASCRPTPMSH